MKHIGLIEKKTVGIKDGRIVFVGKDDEPHTLWVKERTDCQGKLVTPGLLEPHTHLIIHQS